jgi:cyclase
MRQRLIPLILMSNRKLVKTKNFDNPTYVGDPRNVVRMFSDFRADELIVVDIDVSKRGRCVDYEILEAIAVESQMPIAYGGGVTAQNAGKILSLGYEKIVLNSNAYRNPKMISECANKFGSQAVSVSIDVREVQGRYSCWSLGGSQSELVNPVAWALECVKLGAGEILLTVINREGTWKGTDTQLTREIADQISVPLVTNGGVGSIQDVDVALLEGRASAVAAGSYFVFQQEDKGVLISYPPPKELNREY